MPDAIYEGKGKAYTSGNARGGPIACNRCLSTLRSIGSYAVECELIPFNPFLIRRPGQEHRKDRVLDDTELAAVLDVATDTGFPYGPYYQFLTYVPCRRGEALILQWADLDLDAATWTQKTNKSKRLAACGNCWASNASAIPRPANRYCA